MTIESSTPLEDTPETIVYTLPKVESFDDVNNNFASVADLMTAVISGMKEHSENTNENLRRLAEETSANLTSLSNTVKSILSSQTMMLMLALIAVATILAVLFGSYEFVRKLV